MKSKNVYEFINGHLCMGLLSFTAADIEYCAMLAEKETEERMQAKAHKIVKEMMNGIFQGDMPQKIADEFIQKLTEE